MKKLLGLLSCIIGFTLISIGCRQENYKTLSVDEFEKVLQKEGVQLLDVRTNVEYTEGHIPGAININVMDISFLDSAASVLHKSMPIAVYCRSGKRSNRAARILTKAGYQVGQLHGGFNAWKCAGKEANQ